MIARARTCVGAGGRAMASHAGLLATVIAGLAPMFWIPPGMLAKTEDFFLPITFERWLGHFSTWHTGVNFGTSPDDRLPAVFFMFWPAFYRWLGFSLETAQRLQMTTWFMAGGLAMYVLMAQLARSEVTRLGAVLVYLFNFYQEPVWQGMNIANLSAWVVLPLMLGIVVATARGGNLWARAGVLALASIVGSGAGVNPPMAMMALVPVPLYVGLFVVRRWLVGDRAAAWRMVRFGALALVLVLLVNAYWLAPQVAGVLGFGPQEIFASVPASTARAQLQSLSLFTGALNVLRLQGHWVWYDAYAGTPFVPHSASYLGAPELILGSAVLAVAALAGLIVGRDRRLLYFGLLFVLGLAVSTGANGPTGPLFLWAWDHLPFAWFLRSPWYKATALTVLGAAPLAGVALAAVASRLARWGAARWPDAGNLRRAVVTSAVVPTLLAAPYLVYAGPVVRGDFFVVRPPGAPLPGQQVRLPEHLYAAQAWLDAQPGRFRVLALPPALRLTTDWGYTGYLPPLGELSDRTMVTMLAPSEAPLTLYRALLGAKAGPAAVLLARAGVRYVMQQDDVQNRYFGPPTYTADEVALAMRQQGLEEERRFGPLRFYRVPAEKPAIWGTQALFLGPFDLNALRPLSELADVAGGALVLTPRIDPAVAWALLHDAPAGLSVVSFGSATETYLSLRALDQAVKIADGTQRVTVTLPAPGTYEWWVESALRDVSGLDAAERLRQQGSAEGLHMEVDAALVNGAALQPSPDFSLTPTGRWRLAGTSSVAGWVATLELPAPVADPQGLRLMVVNRAERQEAERALLRTADRSVAQWWAFLTAQPHDVVAAEIGGAQSLAVPKYGWGEPRVDAQGLAWRPILGVHKGTTNLTIENPSGQASMLAMALRVRSHDLARSLWVRRDGQTVALYVVAPNVEQSLLVEGVRIAPGPNAVNLYSPNPEVQLPDGQFRSFEFAFPVAVGRLSRVRTFAAGAAGRYEVALMLGVGEGQAAEPRALLRALRVDGNDLLDDMRIQEGTSIARAVVWLEPGRHTLEIDQHQGVAVPVLLGPQLPEVRGPPVRLTYERLRPTHYRVAAEAGQAYVLVLNDLYDPRWTAYVDGREVQQHFEVNGFANGFLVEATGPHVVEIEFKAQRLADATLLLSVMSAAAMAAGLLAWSVVRWRRA